MRVLLVEDNRDLAEVIRKGLAEEGYAVDVSRDGEDGLWRATTVDYDIAILDILLPRGDGRKILTEMRARGSDTPVIFLTARDAIEDRVEGLDLGADDYLVKPFAWDELLARIRALLRRKTSQGAPLLSYGPLEMDPAAHRVSVDGRDLDLTAKEFQILEVFLREPGRVFSRTDIVERVYDDEFDAMSNVVDVFLSRLRRKLRGAGSPDLLATVRGVGYVLRGGEDAQS